MEVITEDTPIPHKLSSGNPQILLVPEIKTTEKTKEILQSNETNKITTNHLSFQFSSTRSSFESTEDQIIDEKEITTVNYIIETTVSSNPTVEIFTIMSCVKKKKKKIFKSFEIDPKR